MSSGSSRHAKGQPRAGWHPDPWMQGRQLRFFDGFRWTQQVAPLPAAPAADRRTVRRRPRVVFSVSVGMFVVVVIAVIYAMVRGQDVDEVSATGVKFRGSGSSAQIQEQQASMESRLSDLERKAKSEGSATPAPQGIDLSGTWNGGGGFRYEIQQFGSDAVIQEISQFGVTATGYGAITNGGVQFTFEAFDGSTGVAQLQLVDNNTLQGTFQNHTYGTSAPAVLRR